MAKGTRNLTVTTVKGTEVTLTLNYESSHFMDESFNDGWGGTLKESYISKQTVTVTIGDTVYGTIYESDIYSLSEKSIYGYKMETLKTMRDGGATHVFSIGKNVFAVKGYDAAIALWSELESQVDNANVKRIKGVAIETAKNADITEANDIMAAVDTTIANVGKLPTVEEAKKWRASWNRLHNEGGEGYIPAIVTDAQVEWAKKVLARA